MKRSFATHIVTFLVISMPVVATAATPVTLFELGEGKESQYGFRIPSFVVTKSGAFITFCERRLGLHDHAENDIVMRRSEDGGKTWQPLQVVAEEGGDSLNDPCTVVLESGRILLRYTHFPKGVHARNSKHTVIADEGYDGPKTVRIFLIHSDDDGQSWSKPRDVTRVMRRATAISLGSPGTGLQLVGGQHKGRILLPNYEVYHLGGGKRKTINSVCYSDDGGATWTLSPTMEEPDEKCYGDEAQMVELADGQILLSARNHQGGTHRKLALSKDSGQTWTKSWMAGDLLTPPCMSAVIRYSWQKGNKPGVLLHSLPYTKTTRKNGTLLISRDEGESWSPIHNITPTGFEYSCLARLPNGDVGCVHETDHCHSIVFLRLSAKSLGLHP